MRQSIRNTDNQEYTRREAPPQSALTSFETRVLLVDDVYTTLTAHHAVVAVAGHQRFERVLDLHDTVPRKGPLPVNMKRAPKALAVNDFPEETAARKPLRRFRPSPET